MKGIEPTACGLQIRCSANWATPACDCEILSYPTICFYMRTKWPNTKENHFNSYYYGDSLKQLQPCIPKGDSQVSPRIEEMEHQTGFEPAKLRLGRPTFCQLNYWRIFLIHFLIVLSDTPYFLPTALYDDSLTSFNNVLISGRATFLWFILLHSIEQNLFLLSP